MRPERHRSAVYAALAVAAVGLFHIARPIAVSAQSVAAARVQATVVAADGAWAGHLISETLIRRLIGDIEESTRDSRELRRYGTLTSRADQKTGTVVWVEPTPMGTLTRVVTVAHLAN